MPGGISDVTRLGAANAKEAQPSVIDNKSARETLSMCHKKLSQIRNAVEDSISQSEGVQDVNGKAVRSIAA